MTRPLDRIPDGLALIDAIVAFVHVFYHYDPAVPFGDQIFRRQGRSGPRRGRSAEPRREPRVRAHRTRSHSMVTAMPMTDPALSLVRDALLDELRAEWPDGGWVRDGGYALDEDDTTVRGLVSGRYVLLSRMEPDDLLATAALQWEASSGDANALGRTPVEAVRVLLRRAG